MLISEFDYDLPGELIAQQPLDERSASRMLVVDRGANKFDDRVFSELPSFLRDGDLLVVNNTKVFPARLLGQSETGANVELFLVEEKSSGIWETLARPARRLRPGKRIDFGEELTAEVLEKTANGKVVVQFAAAADLELLIDKVGRTPLPPYIKREEGSLGDRERYQTVYAKERGAIAAPTAGLHFTGAVLAGVHEIGAEIAEITLHVGYGTFEPVRVENVAEHRVMSERYSIDESTAERLNVAKIDRRRIVAIGTTTTRALESNIADNGRFAAGNHAATLTITPGYKFRAVDAMLTNFHLPRSSLLVLTSTFGGHELIMSAYEHAVAKRYRFYSYGDCMLVV
ncbi:MAG TPA: tRNA preQ1(34) S-adenosylmethionine ribosyltransferase-isomerase QueA [Pyrinomonadaceae bacterium]|jgi:S-adenosylmethionine:tRNA ribosyltransferase-isomerase|nr:tRNA preQ1(34) S-adenosylmethionine ribosyltransferase-isomerase QueA [Pyrinomonadaceae bacterium]